MTVPATPTQAWFAVRCVVHHANLGVYEERLTLSQSPSVDDAIALAEDEAREYAHGLSAACDADSRRRTSSTTSPGTAPRSSR